MIHKANYTVSAWGEVRLPVIIIIGSTNVKVVIMMWNGGLKEKRRDWITR